VRRLLKGACLVLLPGRNRLAGEVPTAFLGPDDVNRDEVGGARWSPGYGPCTRPCTPTGT
jgi:hypothetical protein